MSFPGESREYVSKVADELRQRLPKRSLFYDGDFAAQLARPNLDTLLQSVYGRQSDLVVVFLSEDYDRKDWCGLERRSIREIIKRRSDHTVMLMRFDDATVPGVMSLDGYIDLRQHQPTEAAAFILERVSLTERTTDIERALPVEVFRMSDGDQTTYINLARFSMMLEARGVSLKDMPPTNRRLLDVERIGSTVFALQKQMKAMNFEAIPFSALKTVAQCELTVGKLISFRGRFRSSHAPRVRAGAFRSTIRLVTLIAITSFASGLAAWSWFCFWTRFGMPQTVRSASIEAWG